MLCWWCCHAIPSNVNSGDGLHIPVKLVNDTFHTKGHFCSWECMKAHNANSESYTTCRVADLITLYRKKVYGKIEPLTSAPSRFTLVNFGGTVSIDDYRSGKVQAWITLPNEVFAKEIIRQKTVDGDLVIKRNKPLKRENNGIQSALGISLKK